MTFSLARGRRHARTPHLLRHVVRPGILLGIAFGASGALASCVGSDPSASTERDGGSAGAADATVTGPDVDSGDAAHAATRACADGKAHDFCDDFEDKTRVDDGWTLPEIGGSGTLDLAAAPAAGGMAMRSALGGSDGGTTAHLARLIREFPFAGRTDGTMPKVIVGFDLFIEAGDAYPRGAAILGIKLGETETGAHDGIGVYLDRDEGDATKFLVRLIEFHHVDGGVLYPGALTDVTVTERTWTHVEAIIGERAPGSAGGMILTVGGGNYAYAFASNTRTTTMRVDVGHAVGSVASGRWLSYVDNVTMDVR